MLYKAEELLFRIVVPKEFSEEIIEGPQIKNPFFADVFFADRPLHHPITEQTKGFSYGPEQSIALLIRDIFFQPQETMKKAFKIFLSMVQKNKKESKNR